MCYFSKSLHPSSYRDAKKSEDLIIRSDGRGHHFAGSLADGKIVCIRDGAEVHIQDLQVNMNTLPAGFMNMPNGGFISTDMIMDMVGKPCTGRFRECQHRYAADWVQFPNGTWLHLTWIKNGTRLYVGTKKAHDSSGPRDMEKVMGLDQLRVPVVDEAPTMGRTIMRAPGLCSIVR